MNIKQKIIYMSIGCLFTLAGYFLASLSNNQPPAAHAQDNTNNVIDEIVCKKIRVVNDIGNTVAEISSSFGGGNITVHNGDRKIVAQIESREKQGLISIHNREGKNVIEMGGLMQSRIRAWDYGRKGFVEIGGRYIAIHNREGKTVVEMSSFGEQGDIRIHNKEEKTVVGMSSFGEQGFFTVDNKAGKPLVVIDAIKDRPNDGLINIYNYKGERRSITTD